MAFTAPEDGSDRRGPVQVTGTAPPDSEVALRRRARRAGRADHPDPSRWPATRCRSRTADHRRPDPVRLTADAQRRLQRHAGARDPAPGTWALTVDGQDPVTRRVTVGVGEGLSGLLRVSGRSYLEIEEDGQPKRGVSGGIADAGDARQAGGR